MGGDPSLDGQLAASGAGVATFGDWPEPAVVADDRRRVVAATAAACHLLGLSPSKIVGSRLDDIAVPSARRDLASWWRAIQAGRVTTHEVAVGPPDGVERVRLMPTPSTTPGLHVIVVGNAPQESAGGRSSLARERDLDEIERIAQVGSWTLDPASGEATWSTEMYRILGLDPLGPPIALSDIARLFTEDSVARVGAAVERAVTTGESWHMDLEVVRPDGQHGWVASNGIAERDATGSVVRIHGTMQDVTEQRRLEAQLQQSQRLEAVGQLAGGIAHDFNNILTAVRGYTQLVRDDLEPADPRAADLDHALSAAERAAELVRQLLAFSRRQVLQPRILDPTEVIDGLVPLLRRLLGEGIELTATGAPDLGRVLVDPGQLGQVIVNLAVNARDAMPRGGRLTIEARNVELDAAYAATHLDATPGPHVLIAVSDTGQGMDTQTQARAFEPFFTTKGPDKGTGMGLATVYGIVKQSGGSIYLYSEPERGTTFKLYFPRTRSDSAETTEALGQAASAQPNSETVLLVEDDADVRGYARRVLEAAGFTVVEAADGPDAIELARGSPAIDLLLTDAVLPGMHGAELAERLVADRPGLRVLFVSGFTENSVIQHGVVAPGVSFLPKPYRAEDLVASARAVLDAHT